jgi:type II secretory pathway pseudopilin PulG
MTALLHSGRRARHRECRRHRFGFTLVELVVSTGIISLLAGSLASIIILASRALPSSSGAARSSAAIAAAAAADQIAQDLRFATSIIETTPTRVTFTVPDRTGDMTDETIVYQWSGGGAPLLRSINGGQAHVIMPALQDFRLDYTRRKHVESRVVSTVEESDELLLSSFTGWPGIALTMASLTLTGTTWTSEKFVVDRVSFPGDITSWRITRVSLRLRRPSTLSSHAVTVGIHHPSTPGGFLPAAVPIGTPAVIPTPQLTASFAWRDAVFSDVVFTDPALKNFVIVVKPELPTNTASIEYYTATNAPSDAYIFQYTNDGGVNWLPTSNRQRNDAPFFVYGRYTRGASSIQSTESYNLTHVAFTLQSLSPAPARLASGVHLANQPETPAP